MKIAILGAASARSPLLVRALAESKLPLSSIAVYDVDQTRLALLSEVSRLYAGAIPVEIAVRPESAIEGARFVLASIRVGGVERRALDEEASIALGIVGQETVGPAGFAMALRNIPPMVAYARMVEHLAPDAFLVNYTNPVGIVTQAIGRETDARVLGICDTPSELFAAAAAALDVPTAECSFDYVGLNHLGWLQEIVHAGSPVLHRLFEDDDRLRRVYRTELFAPEFLRDLGLLPSEYLYFYYRTRAALDAMRRAGRTRGRFLVELNRDLFEDLARDPRPHLAYERYLAVRDRTYFSLETGATTEPHRFAATGYDKIALSVLGAVCGDTGDVIALNVRNGSTLPELAPDDVIEVPSRVGREGAEPLPTRLPERVKDLLFQVKDYERRTVTAALDGDRDACVEALARHPLVRDRRLAAELTSRLGVSGR